MFNWGIDALIAREISKLEISKNQNAKVKDSGRERE